MNDPQRAAIKARIAAEQAEAAQRQSETLPDKALRLGREHPVLAVLAGLLIGALIASLFPGPRRAVRRGGRRASGWVSTGSEIALAYMAKALADTRAAGEAGARRAGQAGHAASERVSGWSRELGYRGQRAGRRAERGAGEIADLIGRIFERR